MTLPSIALEKEKEEVTEAQTTVTELENRKRALAAQLNALKADEEEWSAKVRARRECACHRPSLTMLDF